MDGTLSEEKSSHDYSVKHMPGELLHDVLSRLPVKSLMRFRCVCKYWYSLITRDPDFHKLHFNYNSNKNGSRWIGYQLGENCDYNTTKFWLYDESFISENIQPHHIHKEETPPVDFFFSRIVGSCNGIVCLYLPVDEESLGLSQEVWGLGKFFICLMNPSTRKYRRIEIPWKSIYCYWFDTKFMMGFGLSIKSSVYKIVVIYTDEHEEDHVYVYSLGTSSWTEIGAKPCSWEYKINKDSGTYFNGSCHWIRLHKMQGDFTMMCFNLDDQNFRYIDLPPKSQFSPPYDCFKTVIFKDMLCVWETVAVGVSFAVNIWCMKECGNCSSWSVLQTVYINEDYWFQHRYFRLFGIDARGRLLFKTSQDESPLRACDSQTGEIQEFQSPETVDIWEMAPYRESLFRV